MKKNKRQPVKLARILIKDKETGALIMILPPTKTGEKQAKKFVAYSTVDIIRIFE